jgi:hypothetical protein
MGFAVEANYLDGTKSRIRKATSGGEKLPLDQAALKL